MSTKENGIVNGDIGERIRSAREQRGITQAELARQAGVSRTFMCEVEAGSEISASRLLRIADVLDASLEHLMRGAPRVWSDDDWSDLSDTMLAFKSRVLMRQHKRDSHGTQADLERSEREARANGTYVPMPSGNAVQPNIDEPAQQD